MPSEDDKALQRIYKHCVIEGILSCMYTYFTLAAALYNQGYKDNVQHPYQIHVCLSIGMCTATMHVLAARTTGCHLSPCVTLTLFISGKVSLLRLLYIPFHFFGAFMGCLLLYSTGIFYNFKLQAVNTVFQPFTTKQAFLSEMVATMVLGAVYLSLYHARRSFGAMRSLYIGMATSLCYIVLGPITQCGMNPAKSISTAMLSGVYDYQWIFWLGPICGAVLCGVCSLAVQRWYSREEEDYDSESTPRLIEDSIVEGCIVASFVFVSCVAGVLQTTSLSPMMTQTLVLMFSYCIFVAMGYELSGAHITFAVTVAYWAAGSLSKKRVLCYALSQCVGSLVAALFLRTLIGGHEDYFPLTTTLGGVHVVALTYPQQLIIEVFSSALISVIILLAASNEFDYGISHVPLFCCLAVAAVSPTGACISPYRYFGPAAVSGSINISEFSVFYFGSVTGGLLAGLAVHHLGFIEGVDMAPSPTPGHGESQEYPGLGY